MLHWHKCFSCEEPLTCCCDDRRQADRLTGKQRKIFCLDCQDLRDKLELACEGETIKLERMQ